MATIHFVLQGKGGVGKTLISSLIFQYLTYADNSGHEYFRYFVLR
jgi:CO dehydrogenase nickel-insertion accessory protein CooC1